MNVVVEERTREIGIKMALGARSRSAFPVNLEEYVGLPTLSPGLAVLTASILGLVGFVAGYFPARDASHLDPVVAMKL